MPSIQRPGTLPCYAFNGCPDRAEREQSTQPLASMLEAERCRACGTYYADPPSALCPGCEAYQEHER